MRIERREMANREPAIPPTTAFAIPLSQGGGHFDWYNLLYAGVNHYKTVDFHLDYC